jgi:hypothetical protein
VQNTQLPARGLNAERPFSQSVRHFSIRLTHRVARWRVSHQASRFLIDFAAVGLAEQLPDGRWQPTDEALQDPGRRRGLFVL